jgi:sugar O-acyltransferase (sialic acid O-acetyltransferase NeuD family)
VIIIGGGGHAKVLASMLLLCERKVLGFVDLEPSPPLLGIRCLGDDTVVKLHSPRDVQLVNGVGSTGSIARRQDVHDRFTREGYRFASVIHPSSLIAAEAQIEEGVQVMAGAVIQAGTKIGANSIVNSGAIIDHDCALGAHVHVAPGAVLSGGVRVGDGAHIGTGACVIQGIVIGSGSVVGAGAVVTKDVPPGVVTVGVPAKSISSTLAPKISKR